MIKIAKVVNTRGIRGEIKLFSYSNVENLFEEIPHVIINDIEYEIEYVKYIKNSVILKLAGIENPEDARRILVGKDVYSREEDMPSLDEDSYYVKDVIGIKVYDEEIGFVGKLKDIFFTPANDVYEVETDEGKTILIPAVKEFIVSVDTENDKMIVKLIEGMV